MTNTTVVTCHYCQKEVAVGDGETWDFKGKVYSCHAACSRKGKAKSSGTRYQRPYSPRGAYASNYTRFSSGAEVFTNRNGRCEDAPCCGCCS